MSLAEALSRSEADLRATAYDVELDRHGKGLHSWYFDDPQPGDKSLPYDMTFKAKTNMYGGLERQDARFEVIV